MTRCVNGSTSGLSAFSRTLGLALSTVSFTSRRRASRVNRYKDDLKFFQMLRRSVQRRYQEVINYDEYECTHSEAAEPARRNGGSRIGGAAAESIRRNQREAELSRLGSDASKADAIAHQTEEGDFDEDAGRPGVLQEVFTHAAGRD